MPSKRKKNKRRMRRVQAQRRALEEQYSSSGKGAPGVCAVSAPVPARVPVAKTPECPVSVPIPLAVIAPVDVPSEVPPAEPVVLEVPVTEAAKDKEVKAAEDLEQSLVEPPAEDPAVIEEDETVTVPVLETISSIDEPVSIPAESEIQFEDTTPVTTETHVLAQLVETIDNQCEVEGELPTKDPVEEVPVPEKSVTPADTVAAVETVTETAVTEVEPVVNAAVEVDGHVVGVLGEPAIESEAITVETEPVEVHRVTEVKEDVHAEPKPEPNPFEITVEAAVTTEALVEPEPEQQQTILLEEPTPSVESTSDPIVEELVVTESVVSVVTTVTEEQIPETKTNAPKVPSETLVETIPAAEPLPVPEAKEIIQDLAVTAGLTVDVINGCLGATEVAIEG
ncbi:calphotin isoform X2 [Pseudorasbora parva]|uniref:calphotin isoform X2 n=1 Tax=Pseudorasbora parva TaxID=51549 RepID=UPI00351E641C